MVRVVIERSKSRSGIHACRRMYVVIDLNCNRLEVQPANARSIKPTYSRGEAYESYINVPMNYVVVQMSFIKGLKGRVKGELFILDSKGNLLCKALYRKLKLRLIGCSDAEKYLKIIKCIASSLKIPVKRYSIIKGWNEQSLRSLTPK